jgi:hypothetical protein
MLCNAEIQELFQLLREAVPPNDEGWWCPECRDDVVATFSEHCATCGLSLTKINSPVWVARARTLLEKISKLEET